jgi:hypothetical protein
MKVKLLIAGLLIVGVAPAQANEQGAWVKVNVNGNAVGEAIVCTSDVCGNSSSEYAKATLNPGERYVLQFKADPITNNSAGIGNNSPGVEVKVDLPSNTWSLASTLVTESPKSPITNESIKIVTTTVQTFNPFTQPVPVTQSAITVERKIITDWNDPDFDWETWWDNWLLDWEFFGNWYYSLFDWGTL